MSQSWPGSPGPFSSATSATDPSAVGPGSTRLRPRTPRRSLADRKLAGVAGGIGRALGIDPLLLRVAFVVLTVFGGFGALLYVVGWLLMPADGDEASAAQALLGRGRSSVSPALAVVLAVLAAVSLFSTVFWGFPFLPFLIVGGIALIVLKRRRHWSRWDQWSQNRWHDWNSGTSWPTRSGGTAAAADRAAGAPWDRAGSCGRGGRRSAAGRSQYWGGPIANWTRGWAGQTTRRSPFERPAFWEEPAGFRPGPASDPAGGQTRSTGAEPPVDLTKNATPEDRTADPFDLGAPRATPPAWDPLGAAPFAWDLPEPTPIEQTHPGGRPQSGRVLARVTTGLALFAGAVMAAGILIGWWVLPWAAVAATALSVVGVGLLVSALLGRGYALAGPGVFLSLVTLALTTTGLTGTSDYGHGDWTPTTSVQLERTYEMQAGYGYLDLTNLALAAGETKDVTLQVNAGRAEVDLPKNVAVNMTCKTLTGHVNCNGKQAGGFNRQLTSTSSPAGAIGTVNLLVEVRAGEADVQAAS